MRFAFATLLLLLSAQLAWTAEKKIPAAEQAAVTVNVSKRPVQPAMKKTSTYTPKVQKKDQEKEEEDKKEKEKNQKEKDEKEKKEKEEKKKQESDTKPWFIGTLLATFSENIAPDRLLVEPNYFYSRVYGIYGPDSSIVVRRNIHLYTALYLLETGITKEIDVAFFIPYVHTNTGRGKSSNMGDVTLQFGFQVSSDKKGTWVPDFRVLAGSLFPTGKFDRLNPALGGADATGEGSFSPFVGLVIQKIFYSIPCHPYSINFNFFMYEHTRVAIRDISIFGGVVGDRGTVTPGEQFIWNLAFEYKFDKNWGCGIDIHYIYQNRSSFSPQATTPLVFPGAPSSNQFSLAPEIEYDFSAQAAMQFALWFTVFGRNSPAFYTGTFLFSYLF